MTRLRPASRGQALAETLVASTVLVLLMLALPAITALQEVQRSGQRAAVVGTFLSAWDRGRSAPAELRDASTHDLEVLPWAHPADAAAIVEPGSGVSLTAGEGAPPGRAAGAFEFITGPLREAGSYLNAAFDLSPLGFHRADVTVRVPPLRGGPEPFSQLELELSGHAVLLADAWNAAGSAQVRERVRGLVPTAALRQVQEPVRALSDLVSLVEPAFERFCPGLVEAEPVPASRLETPVAEARIATPARGGEAPECH